MISTAAGNRAVTTGVVLAFLVATRVGLPDPASRGAWQYVVVITLGYGHLVGAAASARRRRAPSRPGDACLRLAFAATNVASLFAAYCWAVGAAPTLLLAMLALSVWHIVENDAMLGRVHASGLRIGPMRWRARHHAWSLGVTAVVALLATAASTPADLGAVYSGPPFAGVLAEWIAFSDVFTAVVLYHLVSWILLSAERVRRARCAGRAEEARLALRRLLLVHALPAAVCVGLLVASGPVAEQLRWLAFSPSLYLFWSLLHVAQTLTVRGREAGRTSLAAGAAHRITS